MLSPRPVLNMSQCAGRTSANYRWRWYSNADDPSSAAPAISRSFDENHCGCDPATHTGYKQFYVLQTASHKSRLQNWAFTNLSGLTILNTFFHLRSAVLGCRWALKCRQDNFSRGFARTAWNSMPKIIGSRRMRDVAWWSFIIQINNDLSQSWL